MENENVVDVESTEENDTEIEFNYDENPILKEAIPADSEFKELVVNYVGNKFNPDNNEVTVEMVVVTMMQEFPEFLMAIAEENFIRGYQQALADVEESEKRISELEKVGTLEPGSGNSLLST